MRVFSGETIVFPYAKSLTETCVDASILAEACVCSNCISRSNTMYQLSGVGYTAFKQFHEDPNVSNTSLRITSLAVQNP